MEPAERRSLAGKKYKPEPLTEIEVGIQRLVLLVPTNEVERLRPVALEEPAMNVPTVDSASPDERLRSAADPDEMIRTSADYNLKLLGGEDPGLPWDTAGQKDISADYAPELKNGQYPGLPWVPAGQDSGAADVPLRRSQRLKEKTKRVIVKDLVVYF